MPKLDHNNIQPPFYNDHSEVDDEFFEVIKTKALDARERAHCPYSNFRVGCALLTVDGKFFQGGNVENASFPAGDCAERVTITKAVSEGYKKFKLIAISADTDDVITPCGVCRQVIREFADAKDLKFPVYMFNKDGSLYVKMFLDDLLPLSFGPQSL